MKIFLHDDFTGGSINTDRWTVLNTVTLENQEAVIQKTTGDTVVGGALTSNVSLPPSFILHYDDRLIRNTSVQSGAGFWSTQNIFFHKTNPDWTQGENHQILLVYHIGDDNTVVEVFFHLYHRSSLGAAEIGTCLIPLDLFESLDIDGTGAVVRDLNLKVNGKKFILSVGNVTIDEFEDANPLHVQSPIEFGTGDGVNYTAKESLDNVLVTNY